MNRIEKGQMSRRERQIMDILYRLGQGSAKEVMENLPDPPSYSAVRALMATLEFPMIPNDLFNKRKKSVGAIFLMKCKPH